MQISFLESGRVLVKLKSLLNPKSFDEIDLAVAYLSKRGYSTIEESLKNFLFKNRRVRFLVGLSSTCVTESGALRKLVALTNKPGGKCLEVKYHRLSGIEFHPKIVLAKSKGKLKQAIVGSSNLTGGGQESNVEANVAIEIEDLLDENTKSLQVDITNFFDYLWGEAKILDYIAIKEYALDEKAKRKPRRTQGKVPSTSLRAFVYLEDHRMVAESFEVLCTDCRKEYVKIPINAFCCDDCGKYPLVKTRPPNKEEQARIRQLGRLHIKIDGKKLSVKEADVHCPECNGRVGIANDFMLWLICEECAEKRRLNGKAVCKPYKEWDNEIAKNLSYGLDENKLIVERKGGSFST